MSRVLKVAGSSARERWLSGSTALNFPINSTVKAGRIATSGSLCLLPLLGCLAFCSPSVGHDGSAVDYDGETKAPGQRREKRWCAPGPDRTGFNLRVDSGNLVLQGGIDCDGHVLASTRGARAWTGRSLTQAVSLE